MIPGPRQDMNPARTVTRPDVTLSACTLVVRDLDEAVDFYRDVLGFDVRTDGTPDRPRWVSAGPPSQPGTRILLQPPAAHRGASPADLRAIDELTVKGLLGRLVFTTDDCDATFEYLEAAGAEVIQEPIDQPYGVRDCAFSDPSGNMLRFIQHRG